MHIRSANKQQRATCAADLRLEGPTPQTLSQGRAVDSLHCTGSLHQSIVSNQQWRHIINRLRMYSARSGRRGPLQWGWGGACRIKVLSKKLEFYSDTKMIRRTRMLKKKSVHFEFNHLNPPESPTPTLIDPVTLASAENDSHGRLLRWIFFYSGIP